MIVLEKGSYNNNYANERARAYLRECMHVSCSSMCVIIIIIYEACKF